MFTGIVQATGSVKFLKTEQGVMRLGISTPLGFLASIEKGASIAVDGVCLTVVDSEDTLVFFDVIEETRTLTTLGNLAMHATVNLERSLRVGDEIGGHLLSGHVFGTAIIREIRTSGDNRMVQIQCPPDWMRYILPKGFIAIDGISLTLAQVENDASFWVNLIPETRQRTTLELKKIGDCVNIEMDAQTVATVTTVERVLHQQSAET